MDTKLYVLIILVSMVEMAATARLSRSVNIQYTDHLQFTTVAADEGDEKLEVNKPITPVMKRIQMWNGIEVLGCGGTWKQSPYGHPQELLFSNFAKDIDSDVASINPVLTVQQAFDIAVKHVASEGPTGSETTTYPGNANNTRFKKVIYINPTNHTAFLVYYFDFLVQYSLQAHVNFTNAFVLVNANTGVVMEFFENLRAGRERPDVMKGEGGNINVGQYVYGQGRWAARKLKVTRRGQTCFPRHEDPETGRVTLVASVLKEKWLRFHPATALAVCFDGETVSNYSESCKPESPNKDATSTSYSQVHDALFFSTHFQELLVDVFDERKLLNCCRTIRTCVHNNAFLGGRIYPPFFNADGGNCDSVFSQAGTSIFDKDKRFLDAVSPTTIGHELGHAMIHCAGDELSFSCQPGAIVEAFCDLTGVLLQASLNNYKADWRYASEIVRDDGVDTAERYMDNPTRDGRSIDHSRDYTCRQVHLDAGVYSKAIYTLANSANWNIKKVYQIFMRAIKLYWLKGMGFDRSLCGLIMAARNYNYSTQDVAQAFATTGVFCECPQGWETRHAVPSNQREDTIKSCFKVFQNNVTFAEANAQCNLINSHLVTLETKAKSDWLEVQLSTYKGSEFWIGGTNLREEAVWKWLHLNREFTFKDWLKRPKIEQRKPFENCLALVKTNRKWGWRAMNCATPLRFVCQLGA